jgi:hypothetical protein
MPTYDPNKVAVVFNGHQCHGFVKGTFVKVSRHEDAFKLQVGADGEDARVRNRDRSGQVEVTLQQTSISNDVLSGMAVLDETASGGYGSLMIKDIQGTTLCTAARAWIKKMADEDLGAELGQRTWIIETGNLAMFVGGNPTDS